MRRSALRDLSRGDVLSIVVIMLARSRYIEIANLAKESVKNLEKFSEVHRIN